MTSSHLSTDAISDASKAIGLDPSMPKAYLRKGCVCVVCIELYANFPAASNMLASVAYLVQMDSL